MKNQGDTAAMYARFCPSATAGIWLSAVMYCLSASVDVTKRSRVFEIVEVREDAMFGTRLAPTDDKIESADAVVSETGQPEFHCTILEQIFKSG